MRIVRTLVFAAIAGAGLLGVAGIFASAGDLNQEFGGDGKVSTDMGHAISNLEAMALQPDGKILAGGDAGGNYAIARFNADGTFDSTWADGGLGTYDFDEDFNEYLRDLVVLDDGKVLGVGRAAKGMAVIKWNANGTVDTSFDGDGIAIFNDNNQAIDGYGIALQSDDKIIAVGRPNPGTIGGGFAMARFTPEGVLDSTFVGSGGISNLTQEGPRDVVIDDQDRIIAVGGTHSFDTTGDIIIQRFLPGGTPDNSLSGDGVVEQDISGNFDRALSVALQDDGKIVIGGQSKHGTIDWLIARFTDAGVLDDTFAGDGAFEKDFNVGNDAAMDIALFDGGIAAAGYGSGAFTTGLLDTTGTPINAFSGDGFVQTQIVASQFQVVSDIFVRDNDSLLIGGGDGTASLLAYTMTGGFDTSFSGDGAVFFQFPGGNDSASAVLELPGGKLLAVGNAVNEGAVARYNANGTLDGSFGQGGRLVINFVPGSIEGVTGAALQDDGKIIVVGHTSSIWFVARLNSDGGLDSSFAGDGVHESTGFGRLRDVVIQDDGRVVAVGQGQSNGELTVLRLLSNGTPDPDFGDDGIAITGFEGSTGDDSAEAVILDGDKIVVAGHITNTNDKELFAIARFNADGSPDDTFAGDGDLSVTFSKDARANAVAVMANGSYVMAGAHEATNEEIALAAVTSAGLPDSSLGGDGKVEYKPNNQPAEASSVAVQDDGKVVVGGYLVHAIAIGDMIVARFDSSGTPDSTFSGDGYVQIDFEGREDWILDLFIRADTTIVAAGYARLKLTGQDFALVQIAGDLPPQPPGAMWGNWNCDGAVDGKDVLTAIAQEAGFPSGSAGCPEIGDSIPGSLTWGNLNCNGTTGPDDWLDLLGHVAGVPPDLPGCPDIGEIVEIEV